MNLLCLYELLRASVTRTSAAQLLSLRKISCGRSFEALALAVISFAVSLFPSHTFAEAPAVVSTTQVAANPVKAAKSTRPIVREIKLEMRDLFEETNFFYRLGNSLKINTKEQVIRRELLFKSGDPYDPFLVQESERILRTFPFLREAFIRTKRDGDFVDVLVTVQDTWTISPQIGFQGGGGTSRSQIGISEGNLLGLGKRVELSYQNDENRPTTEGIYEDPRFLGSFRKLALGGFERSDGYRALALYSRPFRTLVDTDSWETYADVSDTIGRLFVLGDERYIYRQKLNSVRGSYTIAAGQPDELRRRLAVGYEYSSATFESASDKDFDDIDLDPRRVSRDPSQLAEDRKFSGPFAVYEQIEPDFIAANYVDRFERVEDYNLGRELTAKAQFATSVLGSTDDLVLLNLTHRVGFRTGDASFIRTELGASSRVNNYGFENSYLRGEGRYYNVIGPVKFLGMFLGQHTLASSASLEWGSGFDKDRELLLGAENGLRGYSDRTFTGDKRLILNFEDRVHVVEDLFQLINLGVAAFADVGGTSTDRLTDLFEHRVYSDVGVGLRIGFPRASGSSLLRIDIAVPMRNGPDRDDDQKYEPRLFVSTGQAFGARLPAERNGIDRANVIVGSDD